ncbi:MAG: alpha/beta fold hydrolase [Candidatus Nanopelagicales bacterium]
MNDVRGVDAGKRPMLRFWAWWVAAGVLLLVGTAILLVSTDDVQRSTDLAGATPVRVLSPSGPVRGPALVLAHGFSGSAAMMDPMGSALTRAGFVVVAPDLPGHGRNATPLTDDSLEPAIADAVAYAATRTGAPVAVVGHSMGAGAVTSWALDNDPVATVAISLPSAEDLPADPARPRNLLALVGSVESSRFVSAAAQALRLGHPDGQWGVTYGDAGAGTARRAVQVAGAEHISVIYRQQTFAETAQWLAVAGDDSVLGGVGTDEPVGTAEPAPQGDVRLLGVVLVLVAGVLAARPLLAMAGRDTGTRVVGSGGSSGLSARFRLPRTLAAFGVAAALAGLIAAALGPVTAAVPVAVTGYLLGWFAVGALALGVLSRRRPGPFGTLPGLGWGALAGAIVALAMALPARLSWASYALVGPRGWVLALLVAVLGGWFWAEARLLTEAVGWRRGVALVVSRLIVVAGLLGAVVLLGAPGFLTLTVPLVVPILLLLAVLAGWARDPAAAAAAQSVPLALAMATVFPIVG